MWVFSCSEDAYEGRKHLEARIANLLNLKALRLGLLRYVLLIVWFHWLYLFRCDQINNEDLQSIGAGLATAPFLQTLGLSISRWITIRKQVIFFKMPKNWRWWSQFFQLWISTFQKSSKSDYKFEVTIFLSRKLIC